MVRARPHGLAAIIRRRETWLLIVVAGLTGAPVLAFAGLWGVPYFVHVHGLERSVAGSLTSLMLIAWAVGGPLLGSLADRVASRALLILAVASLNGLAWLPFILYPTLPLALAVPLVVLLGLGGGIMIAAFASIRATFGIAAAGLALGIVNSSVLLLGAAMQTVFGMVLDQLWTGSAIGANRSYPPGAYAAGFVLFAAAGGIVALAAWALRLTERQHNRANGNE